MISSYFQAEFLQHFLEEKLVRHSKFNPDLQGSSNSSIIINIFRDPSQAI
jgi:hypothetical protein